MRQVLSLGILIKGAFLFSLSAMAASAYDANVSKVESTGRAAISGDQTQKARRNALEDALYMAALKAGTNISGTAISSKGILVRDIVKLKTQGQLVDFNILDEENTGTHYEVKLQAFFAKKINQSCLKPRYPSVILMAPVTKVSSNVKVSYSWAADYVAKQIIEGIFASYPGPIIENTQSSLSDIKSTASKNALFDYQSLQGINPRIRNIQEDFMVQLDVFSRMRQKRLESHVTLVLVDRRTFVAELRHEHILSSKIPAKTPLRSLNVLMPKTLKVDADDISMLIGKIENKLRLMACKPLEAKLGFSSGQLRLSLGSKSGIKKGALAYVTGGSESWTLLEVSNVTQTSAILKPINTMSDPKRLTNLTVRFIEGAL